MEKYIILVKSEDSAVTAAQLMQKVVNESMEKGYVVAGSLSHCVVVGEDPNYEWHTYSQAMILAGKKLIKDME